MEIPMIKLGKISLYETMIILTIVLAELYFICQKQYTVKQKIIVSITTVISIFIGARLFYSLVNYKTVTISKIFSLRFTDFKLYGGVIFAIINIIVFSKIYKIKITKTLEPTIMWILIGGVLSKIGCFFTGCCKGKPTSLSWGVYRKYDITKVHPSELYDCGAFLFSLITLFVLKKAKVKSSSRIAIALLTYVILRGIIEDTYYNGNIFGNIVARYTYGITIIICLSIIIKDIVLKKKINNIDKTK